MAELPSDGPKKQFIINAFVECCSGHQSPGLWRHPNDQSPNFNQVKHWTKLAQLLERGKFHGIFIADVLVRYPRVLRRLRQLITPQGAYDVYKGPENPDPAVVSGAQWPVN